MDISRKNFTRVREAGHAEGVWLGGPFSRVTLDMTPDTWVGPAPGRGTGKMGGKAWEEYTRSKESQKKLASGGPDSREVEWTCVLPDWAPHWVVQTLSHCPQDRLR